MSTSEEYDSYDEGGNNDRNPPAGHGMITRNNAPWQNALVRFIVICTRGNLLDFPNLTVTQEMVAYHLLVREFERDGLLRDMFDDLYSYCVEDRGMFASYWFHSWFDKTHCEFPLQQDLASPGDVYWWSMYLIHMMDPDLFQQVFAQRVQVVPTPVPVPVPVPVPIELIDLTGSDDDDSDDSDEDEDEDDEDDEDDSIDGMQEHVDPYAIVYAPDESLMEGHTECQICMTVYTTEHVNMFDKCIHCNQILCFSMACSFNRVRRGRCEFCNEQY